MEPNRILSAGLIWHLLATPWAAEVFVGMAKGDFRLKPDAQVFKDLPGFQPIPFDKIGLYVDEYRRKLPTDTEAGRIRPKSAGEALGVPPL